jgi:putative PIN family toxin of toxin-antitoxin system
MRIVLDTDVVVAGLRSRQGSSRAWLRAVLRREVELVLSVPLVLQYEAVLLRPETLAAIGGTPERVGRFLDLLCAVGRPLDISFLWRPMLRDPDDEMVLEAAVHGRADRLLTFNLRDFAGSERLGVRVERPGPAWRAWKGGET